MPSGLAPARKMHALACDAQYFDHTPFGVSQPADEVFGSCNLDGEFFCLPAADLHDLEMQLLPARAMSETRPR